MVPLSTDETTAADASGRVHGERRPVTDQPQVPERIQEGALAMGAPRHLVVTTGSKLPSAPALTARATNASGSSTNTSIRTLVMPSTAGDSQRFFDGSPTKIGAPPTFSPTTEPRFHN